MAAAIIISISAQARLTAHRGEVANGYNYWLSEPEISVDSEADAKPVVINISARREPMRQ